MLARVWLVLLVLGALVATATAGDEMGARRRPPPLPPLGGDPVVAAAPSAVATETYSEAIAIVGTAGFRAAVREQLDALARTRTGRAILDALVALAREGHRVTIVAGTENRAVWDSFDAWPREWVRDANGAVRVTAPGEGASTLIRFDPWLVPTYEDGCSCRPGEVALAHELLHAIHNGQGRNLGDITGRGADGRPVNEEEAATIGLGSYAGPLTENALRAELGLPARTEHESVCPAPRPRTRGITPRVGFTE